MRNEFSRREGGWGENDLAWHCSYEGGGGGGSEGDTKKKARPSASLGATDRALDSSQTALGFLRADMYFTCIRFFILLL